MAITYNDNYDPNNSAVIVIKNTATNKQIIELVDTMGEYAYSKEEGELCTSFGLTDNNIVIYIQDTWATPIDWDMLNKCSIVEKIVREDEIDFLY